MDDQQEHGKHAQLVCFHVERSHAQASAPKIMKSACLAHAGMLLGAMATFIPPSLALIFMPRLAVYCSLPRSLPGLPILALLLTKHWLGMPMKLSVARLTSCRRTAAHMRCWV